jgi:hypothetical protein
MVESKPALAGFVLKLHIFVHLKQNMATTQVETVSSAADKAKLAAVAALVLLLLLAFIC